MYWDDGYWDDGSLSDIKPVTGWMRTTANTDYCKAAIIVNSTTSSVPTTRIARRYANDRLAPSNWSALGSPETVSSSGNSEYPTGELDMNVGENHWVQLGLVLNRASGTGSQRATIHVASALVGKHE